MLGFSIKLSKIDDITLAWCEGNKIITAKNLAKMDIFSNDKLFNEKLVYGLIKITVKPIHIKRHLH